MTAEHAVLGFYRSRRFHVTHPDGTDEDYGFDGHAMGAREFDINHYVLLAWKAKKLQWNHSEATAWASSATVTEQRGWRARFFDGEQWHREDDPTSADFHVPTEAIVSTLNRLAGQGWNVVHVSEDHGLYRGMDIADESFVTRIRYLLRRELPH